MCIALLCSTVIVSIAKFYCCCCCYRFICLLLLLHFVINIMLLFHWTFLFVAHGALLHSIDLSVENLLATVCYAQSSIHRECIRRERECCLHCSQVWNRNVFETILKLLQRDFILMLIFILFWLMLEKQKIK